MKRVFSNPILPLVLGASLRLFFVFRYPGESGDTALYEELATNWLKRGQIAMDVAGQIIPVHIRMPGYPAFLAVVYAITGHTGPTAHRAVLVSQVFVDLSTCVMIGALAALLALLCAEKANPRRAFLVGLWLAAVCPFTANYAAVILTETEAFVVDETWLKRESAESPRPHQGLPGRSVQRPNSVAPRVLLLIAGSIQSSLRQPRISVVIPMSSARACALARMLGERAYD